jgi:hypothetical protein
MEGALELFPNTTARFPYVNMLPEQGTWGVRVIGFGGGADATELAYVVPLFD